MKQTYRIVVLMQDGSRKKFYTQTIDQYDQWAEQLMASDKPVEDIFLTEITAEEAERRGLKD